jgi:hypothetical protein
MDHRGVPPRKHGGAAGRLPVLLFNLGVFLLEPAPARADGKLYARDEVPLHGAYQRAMLLHRDGRELLVIQPKLVGDAKELGWIVPVPAEPHVGSVPEKLDDDLFWNLGRETQPRIVDLSGRIRAGVAAIGLLAVLALIIWGWRRSSRRLEAWLAAFILFLVGFLVPLEVNTRGVASRDVDVLQSARVGIYDVAVLRASAPRDLRAWLEKHGFRSGPEDDVVLASYIARGWCFVTARIARDVDARSAHGLLRCLVLLFQAPEPIYPFALTATSGGETEVLLYVLTEGKVSQPALEMRYAGPFTTDWMTDDFVDWIDWSDTPDVDVWPDHPSPPRFLTKLKGRLSSANAAGDLLFSAAGDDQPYQAVQYRWW